MKTFPHTSWLIMACLPLYNSFFGKGNSKLDQKEDAVSKNGSFIQVNFNHFCTTFLLKQELHRSHQAQYTIKLNSKLVTFSFSHQWVVLRTQGMYAEVHERHQLGLTLTPSLYYIKSLLWHTHKRLWRFVDNTKYCLMLIKHWVTLLCS